MSATTPRKASFRKARFPRPFLPLLRAWYALRSVWRRFRVGAWPTRLLGPQYRRSRTHLEIDITYACNLHCYNCNRSVRQAPSRMHMSVDQLRTWIDEWISRGHRWQRIRVLGGEPTLHPEFQAVIGELLRYRVWSSGTVIEVVTNGYGLEVLAQLDQLPADLWVENSSKTSVVQESFAPFNLAPVDDPRFRRADFSNGCEIASGCGMGLTPMGYYPCALAGGIDRITGASLGAQQLPAHHDDMLAVLKESCRLCGRFRDGHFVPHAIRPTLLEERMSPTWLKLYAQWRLRSSLEQPLDREDR